MKTNYNLLIIGNIYDNHLIRFVKYLKEENSESKIDIISLRQEKKISDELVHNVNEVILINNRINKNNILFIKTFIQLIYYVWSFGKLVKNRQYDIVNIHFPEYTHTFILPILKKITKNIVLTPWGSDVYRIGKIKRFIIKNLYRNANYITGVNTFKFTKDVEAIYSIPKSKQVNLGIGTEMIDFIYRLTNEISTEQAKKYFGIEGYYVITCGYNASKAQRHKQIINAIEKEKVNLPSNLLLLFPFTYPDDQQYKDEIKNLVTKSKLKAIYFEHYLDNEELFYVRQCTDMFIHVQTTDAHNGSLMEYIMLNKKIINGSWLVYDDMEVFGSKPYMTVDSIENLPSVIVESYKLDLLKPNKPLIDYIHGLGCLAWAKKWNSFFIKIAG